MSFIDNHLVQGIDLHPDAKLVELRELLLFVTCNVYVSVAVFTDWGSFWLK